MLQVARTNWLGAKHRTGFAASSAKIDASCGGYLPPSKRYPSPFVAECNLDVPHTKEGLGPTQSPCEGARIFCPSASARRAASAMGASEPGRVVDQFRTGPEQQFAPNEAQARAQWSRITDSLRRFGLPN
jgi:hypothetical protein